MQRCPDTSDFKALLGDSLSDSGAAEIENHLSVCEVCEHKFHSLLLEERRAWETWRELGAKKDTDCEQGALSPAPSQDALIVHLHRSGFTSIEEIGHGGMGIVYRARQEALDRDVAIKVLTFGALSGPERISRFNAEAKAIGKLNHANILQIYGIDYFQGVPYLVLEFASGGDLASRLSRRPLTEPQAAELCAKLAQALGHAHAAGIVHRDIKPSNILFSDDKPLLADFGLAKSHEDQGLTATNSIAGTPAYMSPEQVGVIDAQVGPASDIYAVGVLLYESLCGLTPFRSPNPAETLRMIGEQEPMPPRRIQPKLSRDINTICLKCLARHPNQRYQSAAELEQDLARFLQGRPIVARPVSSLNRLVRWAKKSPGAASLLSLSVILLISLLATWANFTWQLKEQRDAVARETTLANENFRRAHQAIREYLVSFRSHTPLGSKKNLAFQEETISNGLGFYRDLLQNREHVKEFRAEPQALTEVMLDYAELQFEFGKVMAISQKPEQAIEAYESALALSREAEDYLTNKSVRAIQLRGSVFASAVSPLRELDDDQRALSFAQESRRCYEQLAELGAYPIDYQNWYQAIGWLRIGQVQTALESWDAAIVALAKAEQFALLLPQVYDFQMTACQVKIAQCVLARNKGDKDLAIVEALIASEIMDSVCANAAYKFPRYEFWRARAYSELARSCYAHGRSSTRLTESISAYDTAIAALEELTIRFPAVEQYDESLHDLIEECVELQLSTTQHEKYVAKQSELRRTHDQPNEQYVDQVQQLDKHLHAAIRNIVQRRFENAIKCCESGLLAVAELKQVGVKLPKLDALNWQLSFHLAQASFSLADYQTTQRILIDWSERGQDLSPEALLILDLARAMMGKQVDHQTNRATLNQLLPSSNRYVGFYPVVNLLTEEPDWESISSQIDQLAQADLQSPTQRFHTQRALDLFSECLARDFAENPQATELANRVRALTLNDEGP